MKTKLSKTFEGSKGEELNFEFYIKDDSSIENLEIIVWDDKGASFDLTNLFESNKELWSIADKIIDDTIKAK